MALLSSSIGINEARQSLREEFGEWHSPETHAIPIALEAALGRRPYFQIAGTGL